MKTKTFITQSLLLATMSVFGVGCAQSGGSGFTVTSPSSVGTTSTVSSTTLGGTSAAFTPDSLAVMTAYVASHPLNNPQNVTITVNTNDVGSGHFAGSVRLSYNDNGSTYTGNFNSGSGTYNIYNYANPSPYYGQSEAVFNQWFVWNGKRVFHGFFQDSYGGVILVIDQSLDLGDGGPLTNLGGSLWFKNFTQTPVPQTSPKCWFISVGPYDCQTFLVGGGIQTTSALYPTNGYQRLGTFTGLSPQAFGM